MSANLTDCPDCGGQVSLRAATCPHCGAPVGGEPEPVQVRATSSGAGQKMLGGLLMCIALPGCMATGGEQAGVAYGVFVVMGLAGFGLFLTGRAKD